MYKYYNDLIYRQNDSTSKFDQPTLPETQFRPRSVDRTLVKENLSVNVQASVQVK